MDARYHPGAVDTTDIERPTYDAEIEEIKQVVSVLEHAQQNELPDEFVGLFRQDAIWTTGGGKRLSAGTRSRRSRTRYSPVR